ncbi:Presumed portal vertex protein, partial [Klebsiella pneumoniae]
MSKQNKRQRGQQNRTRNMKDAAPQKVEAFTFGEPSAVLDR